VTAIGLAVTSAALFGVMTVALRMAFARGAEAEAAILYTLLPAFLVSLVAASIRGGWDLGGTWPFLLAGVLGPGLSQPLFTFAVRDAGASRTSVTVGTAPLFSVAIALVFLGEPLVAGVVVGALLIVAGGVLLAAERGRPEHLKRIGLVFAFACTVVFATRDNLVRHLAVGTHVDPELAAAATLAAGGATILAFLLVARVSFRPRALEAIVPAGLAFGLSYVCLFEAYFRGRVTVVSPLVATESLWGVALSALFLRHTELVGRKLAAGALLVVAGGILIGVFR
jgi:drug/metabolite transporter (DMT)-like permease